MKLFKSKNIFLLTALVLVFSLLLAGCNVLQSQGSSAGEEGEFETIDLSGEGEDLDEAADDSSYGDDVFPPEALVCPTETMALNLVVNHTWDFSPNRDQEKMKVDGKTAPFVSCSLTVQGSKVTMEDCYFPITNTGFIQTDAGRCDISASGEVVLIAEDPFCEDGKITITIIESLDPDGQTSGLMNCPNKSQPYIPFYPFSITTRTFAIKTGGDAQTENMNPELSNQFKYDKEWTLFSKDLPMPESEN